MASYIYTLEGYFDAIFLRRNAIYLNVLKSFPYAKQCSIFNRKVNYKMVEWHSVRMTFFFNSPHFTSTQKKARVFRIKSLHHRPHRSHQTKYTLTLIQHKPNEQPYTSSKLFFFTIFHFYLY